MPNPVAPQSITNECSRRSPELGSLLVICKHAAVAGRTLMNDYVFQLHLEVSTQVSVFAARVLVSTIALTMVVTSLYIVYLMSP
jgi:hypothetical protein